MKQLTKTPSILWGMITLQKNAYLQASKNTFPIALLFILVITIASVVFSLIEGLVIGQLLPNTIFAELLGLNSATEALLSLALAPIFFLSTLLSLLIFTLIVWGVARLLGGVAEYTTHFSSLTYISLISLLASIPFLGWALLLPVFVWGIVMHVHLTKYIHKISFGRATIAVLTPYVLLLLLAITIVTIVLLFVSILS